MLCKKCLIRMSNVSQFLTGHFAFLYAVLLINGLSVGVNSSLSRYKTVRKHINAFLFVTIFQWLFSIIFPQGIYSVSNEKHLIYVICWLKGCHLANCTHRKHNTINPGMQWQRFCSDPLTQHITVHITPV